MLAKLKIQRERLRPLVRSVLLWLAVGCVGAIIVTVLAEFFVKWAEESGWYSNPSERAARVMSAIGWFLTSSWFIVATAFISGLAAGAWLDWLLRSLERGRPITARALARSLDDFHVEGTRERNRVIPAMADFDYAAERAKLIAWKERLLEKLDVDHISPAEFSALRTLKDFAGWAHGAPNKSEQQNHIEAMWNEHLSRLQAIIYRLSGLPPPTAPFVRSDDPSGQIERQRLAEHLGGVRAELASELAQLGQRATGWELRPDGRSIPLPSNRAEELITEVSYDEELAGLCRDYIQQCRIIADKRRKDVDDREDRVALDAMGKRLFKLLHRS